LVKKKEFKIEEILKFVDNGKISFKTLNEILPEELVRPEELDNIFMYLDAVGVKLYDEKVEEKKKKDEAPIVKQKEKKTPKYRSDIRIDDPIRIYLKDMGKVFLLSREGEVSIAKRIENGRMRIIRNLFYLPLCLKNISEYYEKLKNNEIRIEEFIHVDVNDWPYNYSGWKEKQRVMRLLEGIDKYRKRYCESLKRLKKLKYKKKINEEIRKLDNVHEKITNKISKLKIQEKIIVSIVQKLKELVSQIKSFEKKIKKVENYYGMKSEDILMIGEKRITKKVLARGKKSREEIKKSVEEMRYLKSKIDSIEKNEIILLKDIKKYHKSMGKGYFTIKGEDDRSKCKAGYKYCQEIYEQGTRFS